jgi:hypothetical protein
VIIWEGKYKNNAILWLNPNMRHQPLSRYPFATSDIVGHGTERKDTSCGYQLLSDRNNGSSTALVLYWKTTRAISRLAEHAMSVRHNLGKQETGDGRRETEHSGERSSKAVCRRTIAQNEHDSADAAAKSSVAYTAHLCWKPWYAHRSIKVRNGSNSKPSVFVCAVNNGFLRRFASTLQRLRAAWPI